MQEATARFYASTDYLNRHGRPETLEELARHSFISFGSPKNMIDHMSPLGLHLTPENFRLGSQSGIVAWEYVKQGFGIAPMGEDIAGMCNGLEVVLPQMDPIVFPVWLTTHRELHTSRRIRLVFDVLAEHLTR